MQNSFIDMGTQAAFLLYKRVLYMLLSWSGILVQVALPLAFIATLLMVHIGFNATYDSVLPKGKPGVVNICDASKQNVLFVTSTKESQNSDNVAKFLEATFGEVPPNMLSEPKDIEINARCSNCGEYCEKTHAENYPHAIVPICSGGVTMYHLSPDTNISAWILSINQTGSTVIGGFLFQATNNSTWNQVTEYLKSKINHELETMFINTTNQQYVTFWYQDRFKFGVLNQWNNILLKMRMRSNHTPRIEMSFKEADIYEKTILNSFLSHVGSDIEYKGIRLLSASRIILAALFLTLSATFSTMASALFVQSEISSGVKRLQLIYGANPIVYWFINYLFDFTLFCVTCAICYIPLVIFENPYKPLHHESTVGINILPHLLSVIIPCGYMTISFFYLVSFLFNKTKTITVFIIGTTLGLTFTALFFSILETAKNVQEEYCENCYIAGEEECFGCNHTLWTWTSPVNGILRVFPSFIMADSIVTMTYLANPETFPLPSCITSAYITSFGVLGKRQLIALVMGTIYFAVVLLVEYFDVHLDFSISTKWKNKKRNSVSDYPTESINDPDVEVEKSRINRNESDADSLVVKNLVKTYPKMSHPAVAGVSFGVSASQCFGVLGLNGAGKTTTFKILTGFTQPTSGEAFLNKQPLFHHSWRRFKDSSYCPQDNVLFLPLTVEQNIKIFAAFRAIPVSKIPRLMEQLIHDVGLENHRSKRAAQLSGGNKRKLQLALTMLGNRSVIFLDEPTTGMDPGARRKAWSLIQQAAHSGCSIVLTSHSMEECEVLCDKLVIMIAGVFHCIGSVQYLKDKFGNKYTFKIKLRTGMNLNQNMIQVKVFIKENVPSSFLREEHGTMLEFEAAANENTNLFTIFQALSKCRSEFAIQDISITQTTLEQLFINMSKTHDETYESDILW